MTDQVGNTAPDAQDDAVNTKTATPVTISVLDNDSDADGDILGISFVSMPTNGSVVVNDDNTITYTPTYDDFTGFDSFTYEIDDGNGGTDTATVNVTVSNDGDGNAPPTAVDDAFTTTEGTAVEADLLANDTDPDNDILGVSFIGMPENGTVTQADPLGPIVYTPNPGFTGTDTFVYEVDDGQGGTDFGQATVTVNVGGGENGAPRAGDDSISTPANTPVTIPVLTNDSDPDGDPLAVTGLTSESDGFVVNADGTVTYTPDEGFVGTETATYTVDDGQGGTDTAEITVTVEGNRDGIVEGTPGDDLIDEDYLGDPDTPKDRIDNEDAILDDDAPNDDRVVAGDGDDTVNSGPGSDSVEGGAGDDLINTGQPFSAGAIDTDVVPVEDLPEGSPFTQADDPFNGFDEDDDPEDDRDFVDGGEGNDTIYTGDDRDTIYGGAGNDVIEGGVDDDLVYGGDGNDLITDAQGADTIYGGAGDDTIIAGTDTYTDEPTDEFPAPLGFEGDPNTDDGRDLVDGGAGNDLIQTGDDDDTVYGGAGNDTIDAGIDDDLVYGGDGADSLIGGQGSDTLDGGAGVDTILGGADADVITVASAEEGAGDVVQGGSEGDDNDVLDLTGVGRDGFRLTNVRPDDDGPDRESNGIDGTVEFLDGEGNVTGSMDFFNIEEVIPCFTPGTLIATPQGERLVEDLREGDKVITRDNGIQEIRWTGRKDLTPFELARKPHMKPVLIQKGALGNGLPTHDMLVSPNHRILVNNDKTALYFEEREVLAAAKHLTGLEGVDEVTALGVSYIHFMFDAHEVVLSNGAWTESFQPGDYSLKGIGNAQRTEILELFPELEHDQGIRAYASARRSLKRHEAELLTK
ncbi:Ig-like domain-containing protein [Roseivivax marinus]|uniref:Ig-like domain-containing protein n=1 Tax=Roseivivax marinus TaxID=1379903 RepID=UPI00273E706A|nr:Hint domain-containing protein [Roseivivax marinus]